MRESPALGYREQCQQGNVGDENVKYAARLLKMLKKRLNPEVLG